jgi:hypothetical protein
VLVRSHSRLHAQTLLLPFSRLKVCLSCSQLAGIGLQLSKVLCMFTHCTIMLSCAALSCILQLGQCSAQVSLFLRGRFFKSPFLHYPRPHLLAIKHLRHVLRFCFKVIPMLAGSLKLHIAIVDLLLERGIFDFQNTKVSYKMLDFFVYAPIPIVIVVFPSPAQQAAPTLPGVCFNLLLPLLLSLHVLLDTTQVLQQALLRRRISVFY